MAPMLRDTRPALVLLAALTLTACAGTVQGAATSSPRATSAAPTPSAAATPSSPQPVVTPDDARTVSVTVAGGEVTGDTGRVEVPLGTRVRLSVTADVADEIHVHGFDLYQDVSPGQASQLEFVADRAGVYEVELHDARQVLTRLQIS
jgi:hypothetical protein